MGPFMEEAFREALKAYAQGEVPVGCVILREGEIIARAHNRMEQDRQAASHGEMLAIKQASEVLGRWRLDDCHMVVTLEPCIMCCGAILQSRLASVTMGALDPVRGGVISKVPLLAQELIPHSTQLILEESALCSYLLKRFFRERRKGNLKGFEDPGMR